ncbi:MAG TPA: HPF/RaiA family ribosome-associated protein [Kofleriaceae bacterium]|nr:HPF/RaiA family ribosome-associated protein [Kofleriaceae bacterium]
MQIQINYGQIDRSDALADHINEQVKHALRHHADRFTRVEVHLHDDNGGKNGPNDKRCVMEARPSGFDPIAIEDSGDEIYRTINTAAKKLERAAEHLIDRHTRR